MQHSKGNLISVDDQIRQVLLEDWDPLSLRKAAVARIVYEAYVAPIRQMLIDECSEKDLASYLKKAKSSLGVLYFRRHPQVQDARAARNLLKIGACPDDKTAA